MPTAKVNGVEIEFENGMTVLQVAELAGEEIPRFCYHERLSIAGNCRMCLVEVKPGPPKPQASCALPAAEGQEIITNSPMVKKARQGVMEFLLINHPLDCPICDQGGECDLQDQSMGYGRDATRYEENKRAVEEKYMGPLIKTVMTRCIQCTRCVRFITEVAGVSGDRPDLARRGRRDHHLSRPGGDQRAVRQRHRPLPGRRPDLQALRLQRPALGADQDRERRRDGRAGLARSASMRAARRCCGCCRASTTRSTRSGSPTRPATPATACRASGSTGRMIREGGRLRPATWAEAFGVVAAKIKAASPERIGVIAGDLQDAESMKAALDLFGGLGVTSLDCRQDGAALGDGPRESWLFNSTIAGIEAADAILLIGTNPRVEAPVLNARLRKIWLAGTTDSA